MGKLNRMKISNCFALTKENIGKKNGTILSNSKQY